VKGQVLGVEKDGGSSPKTSPRSGWVSVRTGARRGRLRSGRTIERPRSGRRRLGKKLLATLVFIFSPRAGATPRVRARRRANRARSAAAAAAVALVAAVLVAAARHRVGAERAKPRAPRAPAGATTKGRRLRRPTPRFSAHRPRGSPPPGSYGFGQQAGAIGASLLLLHAVAAARPGDCYGGVRRRGEDA
jgi:hypothetical protein